MLTSLAYVLLLGMALGAMASRLRLPSLVGMLLAGVLRGAWGIQPPRPFPFGKRGTVRILFNVLPPAAKRLPPRPAAAAGVPGRAGRRAG